MEIVESGSGAGNRARTGDPDLGKVVLYQLSYSRPQSAAASCRKRLGTSTSEGTDGSVGPQSCWGCGRCEAWPGAKDGTRRSRCRIRSPDHLARHLDDVETAVTLEPTPTGEPGQGHPPDPPLLGAASRRPPDALAVAPSRLDLDEDDRRTPSRAMRSISPNRSIDKRRASTTVTRGGAGTPRPRARRGPSRAGRGSLSEGRLARRVAGVAGVARVDDPVRLVARRPSALAESTRVATLAHGVGSGDASRCGTAAVKKRNFTRLAHR